MSKKSRPPLRLEAFESRLTPAVTRDIGTLQVVNTTANPNYEWASGPVIVVDSVVGTDTLGGSIDASYTLTGNDLLQANKIGAHLYGEHIRWENDGKKQTVGAATYTVAIPKAPTFPVVAVVRWTPTTTNDQQKDPANNTSHFLGSLFDGKDNPVKVTQQINLISPPTGPSTAGKATPLRPTSDNVYVTQIAALPSPDLPALASGGFYQLLTFDSPNGTDFTFTAANTSGYGVFSASSPNLVEGENGEQLLDPSTTLNPVFLDGSQTAGAYNGTNKDLVVRANSGSQAVLLSMSSSSAMPAGLSSVADGQSLTVPAEDLEEGSDVLWLTYDDGDARHGFVLVPSTSSNPKLTVSDVTVTEGNSGTTNANFTVTLSAIAASNVTVQYATASGTATSGTDFTATSGTLTFTPGQVSKTVTVPVAGDTTFEPGEDFFLTLASATNAVIADGVGLGTISNDDSQPTISIDEVVQAEGNSGTTSFVFTVTLSNPSWQTITVAFATAGGSATSGTDFVANSGTLTFLPGETTKTITVTVYGDTAPFEAQPQDPDWPYPPGEGFNVNLSDATNATLVDAQGLGWIVNDD